MTAMHRIPNKSVLISVRPGWCELIVGGLKTVEIRKTRPKLETPFKVYIYCTKDNTFAEKTLRGFSDDGKAIYYKANKGKVIGEFVCDRIEEIGFSPYNHGEYICKDQTFIEQSCVPFEEMFNYLGEDYGFGWHISGLLIYEKPRALTEFFTKPCVDLNSCTSDCQNFECQTTANGLYWDCAYTVKIPPQSWRYVYRSF